MKSETSEDADKIDPVIAESDTALVSACLQGEQAAWIELLERYKRLIYSVTVRFGFDREDRHDVFQAVCVEILKNLPSLKNASSLRYWILTISVRQCGAVRKRLRQDCAQPSGDAALSVHDSRPDVMEIFLASRRAELLQEALEELPERCRSLLQLLFFSENKTPYSQLGEMFGCSKDTIGSTRLRCLERLRKALEQKGF